MSTNSTQDTSQNTSRSLGRFAALVLLSVALLATGCKPDKGGIATNEPDCMVAVSAAGLDAYAPVQVNFSLYTFGKTLQSASYKFDDGVQSIDSVNVASFGRYFESHEAGQHSVQVWVTLTTGKTCSTTFDFFVRPTPWMELTAAPVPGKPFMYTLTASGAHDLAQLTQFNWDFGGGTPIGCAGWCNQASVVVEFPGYGSYTVTASPTLVGTGLSKAVTIHIVPTVNLSDQPVPEMQAVPPVTIPPNGGSGGGSGGNQADAQAQPEPSLGEPPKDDGTVTTIPPLVWIPNLQIVPIPDLIPIPDPIDFSGMQL